MISKLPSSDLYRHTSSYVAACSSVSKFCIHSFPSVSFRAQKLLAYICRWDIDIYNLCSDTKNQIQNVSSNYMLSSISSYMCFNYWLQWNVINVSVLINMAALQIN